MRASRSARTGQRQAQPPPARPRRSTRPRLRSVPIAPAVRMSWSRSPPCPAEGMHVACPPDRRYHLVDMPPISRRRTTTVLVGGVAVGSDHPIVVQSMTNTDTADADDTALQVAQLAHAGSELVRVTVNNDEAAQAVPVIREKLDRLGVDAPIIRDFHST